MPRLTVLAVVNLTVSPISCSNDNDPPTDIPLFSTNSYGVEHSMAINSRTN